jgi:hypothetical protein
MSQSIILVFPALSFTNIGKTYGRLESAEHTCYCDEYTIDDDMSEQAKKRAFDYARSQCEVHRNNGIVAKLRSHHISPLVLLPDQGETLREAKRILERLQDLDRSMLRTMLQTLIAAL